MCLFRRHIYLCGCHRFLVYEPCKDSSTDVQKIRFCAHDRYPHPKDGKERRSVRTWGPGVCLSVHCRQRMGLVLPGDFGDDIPAGTAEDDSVFDMSSDACFERQEAWLKLLTPQQRAEFDATSVDDIYDPDRLGDYAKVYLQSDFAYAQKWINAHPDRIDTLYECSISWADLNPARMQQYQLHCVTPVFLPASVTAPGGSPATSPLMPSMGPFQVEPHLCFPAYSHCRTCGRKTGGPVRETWMSDDESDEPFDLWRIEGNPEFPKRLPSETVAQLGLVIPKMPLATPDAQPENPQFEPFPAPPDYLATLALQPMRQADEYASNEYDVHMAGGEAAAAGTLMAREHTDEEMRDEWSISPILQQDPIGKTAE